jgi:hypothetical protein
MSLTQHRDAWVDTKQIAPEKLAQFKTWLSQNAKKAIQAVRAAERDIVFANGFRDVYAAIDAMAAASRGLSHVSHMAKYVCDWSVPPLPEFNDQFLNQSASRSEARMFLSRLMCHSRLMASLRVLQHSE